MEKNRRDAIVKTLRSELNLDQAENPRPSLHGRSIILGLAAAGALAALMFIGIDSTLVIARPTFAGSMVRTSLSQPASAVNHAQRVFIDTSFRLGSINCCAANADQQPILN